MKLNQLFLYFSLNFMSRQGTVLSINNLNYISL